MDCPAIPSVPPLPAPTAPAPGLRWWRGPQDRAPLGPPLAWRRLAAQEPADRAEPALLHPAEPRLEGWWGGGPASSDLALAQGVWRGRRCGGWALASATLDEAAEPGGLQAATERVYRDLFALLDAEAAAGRALHLLKVWNYFAHINGSDPADGQDGLERYRQFNVGRRQAYAQARRSASAGVPAACALGTRGGPLTVHVLAGPTPPVSVENPRQTRAYHYPSDYGPRSPIFARAALADLGGAEALLVSGTAAIVGHASLHPGRVDRQAAALLDNLESVWLAAQIDARARHRWGDLALTVYLRQAEDLPAVQAAVAARFGADSPAAQGAVYARADVCRAELLVEVEAQQLSPLA